MIYSMTIRRANRIHKTYGNYMFEECVERGYSDTKAREARHAYFDALKAAGVEIYHGADVVQQLIDNKVVFDSLKPDEIIKLEVA